LEFAVINKFEQNVCKVLKVRESQKFALPKEQFSTGFSTEYVENSDSLGGPLLAESPRHQLAKDLVS
jgi:hypothetical protein